MRRARRRVTIRQPARTRSGASRRRTTPVTRSSGTTGSTRPSGTRRARSRTHRSTTSGTRRGATSARSSRPTCTTGSATSTLDPWNAGPGLPRGQHGAARRARLQGEVVDAGGHAVERTRRTSATCRGSSSARRRSRQLSAASTRASGVSGGVEGATPRSGARRSSSRRRPSGARSRARRPKSSSRRGVDALDVVGGRALERRRARRRATPVRSIALTSRWLASQGASSAVKPVSTFATPPGRSEVASTSDERDGRQRAASREVTITAVLPVQSTGASALTKPEQARLLRRHDRDDARRLGQREVEVRAGDRVRRAGDLRELVGPARVPDDAVDRVVDDARARRPRERPRRRRPRRRTARAGRRASRRCGRSPGRGCRPSRRDQPGKALRAATTASRTSLREACAACASSVAGRVVDRVRAARLRAREGAADRELVGLAHAQARVVGAARQRAR